MGIGDPHVRYEWLDDIVYGPGIRGGFQGHMICCSQLNLRPGRKGIQRHPRSIKEHLLLFINGGDHHKLTVNIQSNISG